MQGFSVTLEHYATLGRTRDYCGPDLLRLEQAFQRTGSPGEHNNRIQIARYRVEVTKEPGPLHAQVLTDGFLFVYDLDLLV